MATRRNSRFFWSFFERDFFFWRDHFLLTPILSSRDSRLESSSHPWRRSACELAMAPTHLSLWDYFFKSKLIGGMFWSAWCVGSRCLGSKQGCFGCFGLCFGMFWTMFWTAKKKNPKHQHPAHYVLLYLILLFSLVILYCVRLIMGPHSVLN